MSEENKALIQRWFDEVWNQGNSNAIDELLAEDGVIHGLVDASGQPVRGLQAFHEFHKQFRGAFPDLYISVDDVIAEGDRVVARCSVRGKHTGEHLGFAATQRLPRMPRLISRASPLCDPERQDCRGVEPV